jgi:anti-sigma B factor antagonist
MELTLDVHSDGPGFTVIAVSGEIDVYTAPKLRERLISLVESGSYQLIVDMEGVEFLDSTGLGVLVGGLKRVRAHDGWIDLVCTQSRILRIFPHYRPQPGLQHLRLGPRRHRRAHRHRSGRAGLSPPFLR